MMRRLGFGSICWAVCTLLTAASCSTSSDSDDVSVGSFGPEPTPTGSGFPGAGGEFMGAGNEGDSPREPIDEPEREIESSFRAPVVTGRYVWSANPDSGRVAVIDANSFEVHSVEAGLRPSEVAALGSDDASARAVVLNRGSSDATLLTLGEAGVFETLTVPTHQGADSWSVQPTGNFAIAWTDSRNASRLDPTDGFQDITVIDVSDPAAPVAVRLTVGYRPTGFYFNEAGTQAFGITEDGISVVDLESGAIRLSRLISLPSSTTGQPDVTVLPNGAMALARLAGDSRIHVIDLSPDGVTSTLELGGTLTDLDVSDNGSWAVGVIRNGDELVPAPEPVPEALDAGVPDAGAADAAVADAGSSLAADGGTFVRELYSEAVYLPLPEGLTDPALWQRFRSTREVFGSVSLAPDASQAVLYTTIGGSGRVTLVNPQREARTVDLLAPVQAVFVTPDSSHAIALQDPGRQSVRKGAFSVISLSDVRAPKRVASDAPTLAVALGADSERALVTVSDPTVSLYGAYLVRMPSLQVDFSTLPSRPLSTGTVASVGKAFVSQAHPEGRLTFFDLESGDSRDITGFELSAKVVNE